MSSQNSAGLWEEILSAYTRCLGVALVVCGFVDFRLSRVVHARCATPMPAGSVGFPAHFAAGHDATQEADGYRGMTPGGGRVMVNTTLAKRSVAHTLCRLLVPVLGMSTLLPNQSGSMPGVEHGLARELP